MRKSKNGAVEPVPADLKAVANMAGHGLTLAEISEELGLPEPLSDSQRQATENAFKRGRASGIAQIRRAQFQAALDGKTAAQAQILKRLGAEDANGFDADMDIEVVRKIRAVANEEAGG